MSGGSDKKSTTAKATTTAEPTYPGAGVPQQFAQAMPGQLNAIAAQLSAGYGAPKADNMAFLDNIYSPMNIKNFPMPTAAPKPAAGAKPKPAATSPLAQLGGTFHSQLYGRREFNRGNK